MIILTLTLTLILNWCHEQIFLIRLSSCGRGNVRIAQPRCSSHTSTRLSVQAIIITGDADDSNLQADSELQSRPRGPTSAGQCSTLWDDSTVNIVRSITHCYLSTTREAACYIISVVSVCLSVCMYVCQTVTFVWRRKFIFAHLV